MLYANGNLVGLSPDTTNVWKTLQIRIPRRSFLAPTPPLSSVSNATNLSDGDTCGAFWPYLRRRLQRNGLIVGLHLVYPRQFPMSLHLRQLPVPTRVAWCWPLGQCHHCLLPFLALPLPPHPALLLHTFDASRKLCPQSRLTPSLLTPRIAQIVRRLTTLPIVPKGIKTWQDALECLHLGFPAVYIANHGGRVLDGVPTAVEILMDMRKHAPEVYADGAGRTR
ncbi:FMN-dependent dehydrogenase-domain-containing protein [Favolaschia claudopus]|uniref:FMN-dependent dehydrogenase-domain-containing protein n=1 Tax=Favolaschia claudopus TaxID=2862362 RepID=A0AAV9ZVU0_9AGAR